MTPDTKTYNPDFRMTHAAEPRATSVLLFDGDCAFCSRWVRFILTRDKRQVLHFASLQSKLGRALLDQHHIDSKEMNSLVVITHGQAKQKSTAVIEVMRHLTLPWRAAANVAWIAPRPLRDLVYDWVARNRYRFLANGDRCKVFDAAERRRFLD